MFSQDIDGFSGDTPVPNSDTAGSNDFASVTLLVQFAKTGPLSELLLIIDLDQIDVVLSAKSLNQFDNVGFIAV